MRIKRINIRNLINLGNIDWTFQEDFVPLAFEDIHQQNIFRNVILKLFYDLQTSSLLGKQKRAGSVEVWLAEKSTDFHIAWQLSPHDDKQKRMSEPVIKNGNGQPLSLPAKEKLGEYVFGVGLRGFQQGGIILWPEGKEDDFYRRALNLRQVGDEELSLAKARDSLTRAKKKVEEQAESMGKIKAEYDVLRRDWEVVNRLQEKQRLLQIEIKNLQANKNHVNEKISCITKIQERLALLCLNSDYRELRRIQAELPRLEELHRETEAKLTAYTRDKQVDWTMIEGLREECLKWACLHEEAGQLAEEIQQQSQEINETQKSLQISGYQELPENEEQRLRLAQEEQATEREELEKLGSLLDEIKGTEKAWSKEIARLQDFAIIAEATVADERRIKKTLYYQIKWQNSKTGASFDRMLKEKFGWTSIETRLSARMSRYCQKYQVADYDEFQRQQKEFQDQQQMVESLQTELEHLRKEVKRVNGLRRSIHSRSLMLKKAFRMVKAADFQDWLDGWEDYCRKRSRVAEIQDALPFMLEQQQVKEEKLTEYVDQLRERIKNWASPASNIDEVLEIVLKAACKLRAKEEAKKEFTALKQRYDTQLDKRNIDHLNRILEPLADLEREGCISNEKRQAELLACYQELAEIKCQLADNEKRLQRLRTIPVMPDLEKKLEVVKLQWKTYEELQCVLDATEELLEYSRQKWQTTYGDALEEQAQRIINCTFSSQERIIKKSIMVEAKQYYFAYRMALVQLAFDDSSATPLFFFVGKMNEPRFFWEDVLAYLQELSLSRQVIFCTSDQGGFGV